MSYVQHSSLGFRLLSAFILVIVIMLSVQTIVYISREQTRLHEELLRKGELLIDLLAYSSRLDVFAENQERLQDEAAGILTKKDVILVGLYDAKQRPLHVKNNASPRPVATHLSSNADVAALRPKETLTREAQDVVEFTKPVVMRVSPDVDALYFGEPGEDGMTQTIGYVRIVMTKDSLNRQTRELLVTSVITGLIFICASVAVILLWVKRIVGPIGTLTQRVQALGKGGDIARVPVETGDEIGGLASAFNTMLDERTAAREAFQKILMDIHDGIGGITTNICMLSEIAQRATDPMDIKQAVSTISSLSREGMMEIRSLMYSLDNKDLTWQMLSGELRDHGTKTVEPHGIAFEMTAEIEVTNTKPGTLLCLHLFRIFREALMNTVKHAKATKVSVIFRVSRERLVLMMQDDGSGFDAHALSGNGRGLPNIKARAAEIGGAVTIRADRGTLISVEIRRPE